MGKTIKTINKIKIIIFVIMIAFSLLSFVFFIINGRRIASLPETPISILIYIGWITLATATTLPITVVLVPGIFLFTFKWAMFYGFLGLIIGGLVIYFLSWYLGREFVREYMGIKKGKLKLLDELIEKDPFKLVLVLNCVYFFPSNLAYAMAGITDLKFWKFLFATIIGNFSNFYAVGLLTIGARSGSYLHITSGVIILVLVTLIPLIIYREHLKEIMRVIFSKKTAESLEKLEKKLGNI